MTSSRFESLAWNHKFPGGEWGGGGQLNAASIPFCPRPIHKLYPARAASRARTYHTRSNPRDDSCASLRSAQFSVSNAKGCSQRTDEKHLAAANLRISHDHTRAHASQGPARPKRTQHKTTSSDFFFHAVGLCSTCRDSRWTLTMFDFMSEWSKAL